MAYKSTEDFVYLVFRSGLNQTQIADKVGYSRESINRMRYGHTPPNGAVMAYLELYVKCKELI